MGEQVDRLLSLAGPALGPQIDEVAGLKDGGREEELIYLLMKINGFYAFESALHVFPYGSGDSSVDLQHWNHEETWRYRYGDMTQGHLFFAEDILGCQFSIKDDAVHLFDPETGESEKIADTIEAWAASICEDFEFRTGYPLAHEWQLRHGPVLAGARLLPKIPFVLGGSFSVGNLYTLDSVKGMRLRAELAMQLRDLPDGAVVNFKIVE